MHFGGSVLILVGGVLCRRGILAGRREKIKILRELVAALRSLHDALYTTLLPIPILLHRKQNDTPKTAFFSKVLENCGEQAESDLVASWKRTARELPLDEAEQEIVSGIAVGFSGTEELLLRTILVAVEQLEKSLEERERQLNEERHLVTALCVSGSLTLLILLI